MIPTAQCAICKDSPPYALCAGEGCARMAMSMNQLMALIEFVRNHAADKCQTVALAHFADCEQWTFDGDVDPVEISEARGADDGATECRNAVQAIDCHAMLTQWTGIAATKERR